MARATVLGKRKATELPPSSIITRKRRAVQTSVNNENAEPEILQDEESFDQSSDIDELSASRTPSWASSKVKSAATKHGARRVALAPTKANGQKKSVQTSKSIEKDQLATPSKSRSRDIFADFVKPTSPASTPKSRVRATSKVTNTPRTPSTPRSSTNVYNCARQLFTRSSIMGQLIGREKERTQLNDFLEDGVLSQSGRALYVSGAPGTGKSAFVGDACKAFSGNDSVQTIYINCMSIHNARDIYNRLAFEVTGNVQRDSKAAALTLHSCFFPEDDCDPSKVYIVTLDEIDHLLRFDLSCLYNIFEWALDPASKLVLIGIANALDFTDRFLPRLKARNLKPQLLPFAPYTVSDIESVITTKLRSLLPPSSPSNAELPFLKPEAIKLLARKVTAQTGDLRKAFDIVRGTIDLIETQAKASFCAHIASEQAAPPTPPVSSPLAEIGSLNAKLSPSTPSRAHNRTVNGSAHQTPPGTPQSAGIGSPGPLAHLTPSTAPRAAISHVARVSAAIFNNGTTSRLASLTLQQKAALCSLLSLEKKATQRLKELALSTPSKSTFSRAMGGVEVRKLWDGYGELVKRGEIGLAVLTRGEFGEVVSGLVEGGMVREVSAPKGRGKMVGRTGMAGLEKVESAVTEGEVRAVLVGVGGEMLKGLLGEQ